jgi:uncharacterized membrane protein
MRYRPLSKAFAAVSAGCALMLLSRILLTGTFRYASMGWNLFLAWIPYILSLQMGRIFSLGMGSRKVRLLAAGFGVAWILFYPNAPYMLTDFMHVVRNPLPRHRPHFLLTSNAILWYDIILNSAFSFTGHLIGLVSLSILHRLADTYYRRRVGWAVASGAAFLGGYGIYLGRFERLNSWDILKRPFSTVRTGLVNLLNAKAVLFAVSMGFFIFLTYLVVHALYDAAAARDG